MPEPAFRRPLGLALAGGGSHGSWQAGFLNALTRAGLVFDKVLGFSAGALTGAGYFLGREGELLDRWRNIDKGRILRFSLRWKPFSLFSDAPVREAIGDAADEALSRRKARCELTVVSLCVDDLLPDYARFAPPGGAWDGPLADKLAASCAIPAVFPPVRVGANGRVRTLVDGGVPGKEWIRFDALAGCRDVIAAQMVRPEEIGRRRWWPSARYDQVGREVVHAQISSGIASLARLPEPPRVFRVYPSAELRFSMLAFKRRHCAQALEAGLADGEAFLEAPERFLV